MLLYDNSNWPLIIIHFKESKWDKDAYDSFMCALNALLTQAIKERVRIRLFIMGTQDIAVPPMRVWRWVIADILRMRPLFKDALLKTSIYTPDNRLDRFFEMLFKVYKPSRPLNFSANREEALQWLMD